MLKELVQLSTRAKISCCILLLIVAATYVSGFKVKDDPDYDFNEFAKLPVVFHGRIKPIDTVARNTLMVLYGKQSFKHEGTRISAVKWMVELMTDEKSDRYKIIRIDHPKLLKMMSLSTKEKYFSFDELKQFGEGINESAKKIFDSTEADKRDDFQIATVDLATKYKLYLQLRNSILPFNSEEPLAELDVYQLLLIKHADELMAYIQSDRRSEPSENLEDLLSRMSRYKNLSDIALFMPIAPEDPNRSDVWMNTGQSLVFNGVNTQQIDPSVSIYAEILHAFRLKKPDLFNKAIIKQQTIVNKRLGDDIPKVNHEFIFNNYQPFYKACIIYVFIFILTTLSWFCFSKPLRLAASLICLITFFVHTLGILTRMYLQGYAPVTNLYSSAIFIGWAAVLLCIIIELLNKDGMGNMMASVIGFGTLIIAHQLSLDGDTMEMMRAVLDSNFWLGTHVVTITIGYSSTFLAGFLGIYYVVKGQFTSTMTKKESKRISGVIYGIVCFSLLLSFVGTVLGGIWADQSWGRFWGWDPKENGALLIVIWNIIILHARWGGYVKHRGLALMAIFGNICTSWSWFGVNMLEVGLHSYGFMDGAAFALSAFVISQLLIIGLGLLPLKFWFSGMHLDPENYKKLRENIEPESD
ncbi:MAG: cytochrome c biogenesis protein CcsA [Lentisphaeria bacterium]|nr:cytochrome c biogenesis protein CcsA [Lentisphaeria bacterium]NQZ70794.1 cytochrome c biogenesis protein CcsA [Lentisphaeria bacterium]